MAPPSELIWTTSNTKKQLWNKFLMETILKEVRNSEEKTHRNAPISWIRSKKIDDTTYDLCEQFMWRKLMETTLKKENFDGKKR